MWNIVKILWKHFIVIFYSFSFLSLHPYGPYVSFSFFLFSFSLVFYPPHTYPHPLIWLLSAFIFLSSSLALFLILFLSYSHPITHTLWAKNKARRSPLSSPVPFLLQTQWRSPLLAQIPKLPFQIQQIHSQNPWYSSPLAFHSRYHSLARPDHSFQRQSLVFYVCECVCVCVCFFFLRFKFKGK